VGMPGVQRTTETVEAKDASITHDTKQVKVSSVEQGVVRGKDYQMVEEEIEVRGCRGAAHCETAASTAACRTGVAHGDAHRDDRGARDAHGDCRGRDAGDGDQAGARDRPGRHHEVRRGRRGAWPG